MSYRGRHEREYIPQTQRGKGHKIQTLEPSIFNGEIRKALDNGDEKELRLEENQERVVTQKPKFGKGTIRRIKCTGESHKHTHTHTHTHTQENQNRFIEGNGLK